MIVILPSNPLYLKVSAADKPAQPPPKITNLLESLPSLDIGKDLLLFNLSLGTFKWILPLLSVISKDSKPL